MSKLPHRSRKIILGVVGGVVLVVLLWLTPALYHVPQSVLAAVEVDGQVVGAIGAGLLVLVCAERGDTEADKLLAKMLKLRIFSDDAGKMNKSVLDRDGQGGVGGLLLVSQFTLAADTTGGNRPVSRRRRPPMRAEAL